MKFLKAHLATILLAVILVGMFLLMFFSVKGDSPIVDEIAHIPSGYSYLTTGDYRLNPEHPPLIKDLAAIPLVIWGANFPYDYWLSNNPVVNNQWEMGWDFIFRSGNNPDTLLLLAKIPMMLLSLIFAYFVYRWGKGLFGKKAGIMALALFAFNVNIIAHSRFVTTDLGISFALFLSMYALFVFIKKPSKRNLIFAGLAFGFTLITKFSAAILAPTFLIVFLLLLVQKGESEQKSFLSKVADKHFIKRLYSSFVAFALIVIIGFVTMWLFYVPHTINMPASVQQDLINESLPGETGIAKLSRDFLLPMSENVVTRPLTQWFLGFFMVTSHVEGGHDAFLLGKVSNQGWWYYYPVALAIKTPIPLFILIILTLTLWKKLPHKDWFTEVYIWILPVVLLVMGMQGKINLGIRYMLPLYAFVFLFVARLAFMIDLKALKRYSFVPVFIVALITWYVIESIATYPHYLSYYNQFVGGSNNGYKYLTDSNTDWGQDIKRLNVWVEDNNIKKIYVDVFPGGFPSKYYLGDKAVEWHVQNGRPNGYFAVSATFYQNSKLKKKTNDGIDYSWLDNIKPVTIIGGSILVYDLND